MGFLAPLAGTYMSNQASSAQAQRQMDFQREMSGTAHQREVEDLRAAGLNPILSAGGTGASTPAGAQGTVSDYGVPMSKGIENAIALRAQQKEFEQIDAAILNQKADTANKVANSQLISNQVSSTALDIEQKAQQNRLLKETLPSMIKEAKAKGDYAKYRQLMELFRGGAAGAGDLLNIGNIFKDLKKGK